MLLTICFKVNPARGTRPPTGLLLNDDSTSFFDLNRRKLYLLIVTVLIIVPAFTLTVFAPSLVRADALSVAVFTPL